MLTVREAIVNVVARSGRPFRPTPCGETYIAELIRLAESEISLAVPEEYVELLRITDGFGTQWDYLFSAMDFLENNFQRWSVRATPMATGRAFYLKQRKRTQREKLVPTYVLLGQSGNQDSFLYRHETARYEIVAFSSHHPTYESFACLGELINHIGREG